MKKIIALDFRKQRKQFNKLNSHIIEKESPKISGIYRHHVDHLPCLGSHANRQHAGKMKCAGVDLRPRTHDAINTYFSKKNCG